MMSQMTMAFDEMLHQRTAVPAPESMGLLSSRKIWIYKVEFLTQLRVVYYSVDAAVCY
jgi:hypothetical protein